MARTRAIRLSDKEEQLIVSFLRQNPVFDFSSLARTALLSFIRRPQIKIVPVRERKTPRRLV